MAAYGGIKICEFENDISAATELEQQEFGDVAACDILRNLASATVADTELTHEEVQAAANVLDAVSSSENVSDTIKEATSESLLVQLAIGASDAKRQLQAQCAGCALKQTCSIATSLDTIESVSMDQKEHLKLTEQLQIAPEWMRDTWVKSYTQQFGEKLSRAQQQQISSGELPDDVSTEGIATLMQTYGLKLKSGKTSQASDLETLTRNIPEDKIKMSDLVTSVELFDRKSKRKIIIHDARSAITANNSQNPNGEDELNMMNELLKKAAVNTIGEQQLNGLSCPDSSGRSNYTALSGFSGENARLVEFRKHDGAKSRLYGLVSSDEDPESRSVEFVILGASSSNGDAAQKRFLKGIGIN